MTALIGTVLAITIRKTNAEIAFLVSIAAGIVILVSVFGVFRDVYDGIQRAISGLSVPDVIFEPLLKCTAISLLTKITAELCRQSGEAALASKVELSGALAGIGVTLPLLSYVMAFLSELLVTA